MDMIELKEVIEMISNLGITIVISAGVVVFIFKLLTMLLKQNQKMVEDIMPRIAELEKSIEKNKSDMMGAITNHNTHTQTILHTMETELKSIDKRIERIDNEQHEFLTSKNDSE